jgi:hypothetical protein
MASGSSSCRSDGTAEDVARWRSLMECSTETRSWWPLPQTLADELGHRRRSDHPLQCHPRGREELRSIDERRRSCRPRGAIHRCDGGAGGVARRQDRRHRAAGSRWTRASPRSCATARPSSWLERSECRCPQGLQQCLHARAGSGRIVRGATERRRPWLEWNRATSIRLTRRGRRTRHGWMWCVWG